jgi:type III pantothenate kinase
MLLIDAGNSRIKWLLLSGKQWLRQGSAGIHEWNSLQQAFASLPPPHNIIVSNVAGDSVEKQLRASFSCWHCSVEFISAQAVQCGVRNGYEQPAQLGSDRWAALIAAWHHEQKPCLVVNCGTATTIDTLSGEGTFIGGLILPGVEMMQRSLAKGTAQLKISAGSWCEFPCNTADAITSGAIQATVGAIHRQFRLLGKIDARCLLSGGAADNVMPYLDLPMLRIDDLVLRGLQILGQDN